MRQHVDHPVGVYQMTDGKENDRNAEPPAYVALEV